MMNAPMDNESIIAALPYGPGFRFVDAIAYIDETRVTGTCYLDPDWPFFKAHFINYPVVPGVILTEVMAQIGLACLAVYLERTAGLERARGTIEDTTTAGSSDVLAARSVKQVPDGGREARQAADGMVTESTAGHKLWAFSAAAVQFLKPVFPGERVRAESERIYYRFGKLKCRVRLYNEAEELVSEGVLEGMLIDRRYMDER